MTLQEKIEKAKTCIHFTIRRSSNGNCYLNGYAPFDCEHCTSYKKKIKLNVKGDINNEEFRSNVI